MSADPLVSIIVPTRNRAHLLARLLESFCTIQYPSWEVIVVDDGSTDTTRQKVEHYQARGLPLVYIYQPWSKMGAARNRGIERARGDLLAFTDDDCLVTPGWLTTIVATFQAHPRALGVQGKTVTDHATMTPFTRQVEQLEGGLPYRTCNIAYRTAIVRKLGGFDPALVRGEDVVMGMRVREHGDIIFAPEAVVIHPPRPKEWADRTAWRTLMQSELHFKRNYARYAPARSQTLSVQKADHVVSRWLIHPIRRYWRWHYAYGRRNPCDYVRQVPRIIGEKLALLSVLPYFLREWHASTSPVHPPKKKEYGRDMRHAPLVAGRARAQRTPAPGDPGTREPWVSVVVPTRNRAHVLPNLLAALDVQTYPAYEVVVVDDASDDSTPDLLHRWEKVSRRVVRLPVSSGSYAARNAGWKAARSDIIAFTDDDCIPRPDWIAELVATLHRGRAAAVQGVTCAMGGERTPFTHQIEQTRAGPPYRTCNMAYRRATLEQLGGFDDSLRWYADNILGLRARSRAGVAFAPGAIVDHPPRPREWRDRDAWLERFAADRKHRQVLRQLGVDPITVPGKALPVVLWVLRPLVKQSWNHLRYLVRHPRAYLKAVPPMLQEKRALLAALRTVQSHRAEVLPPLSEHPLVSVVIVTRDRPELLEGALQALEAQTWQQREVIVVDTGHDSRTKKISLQHDASYHTHPDMNLARARQTGVDAARGEIVAFTDDDCCPHADWLAMQVSAFRTHPELHGVQGKTVAEQGAIGAHVIRVPRADPLYQTCNVAYRRAALEVAGGFDVRFGGWFEDTALGARVLEHGPIGFEPRATVVHRAVARKRFDRETWQSVLADERRLAREYPHFYRQTRGPGFLATVIARWLFGSPLKVLLHEILRSPGDPRGFMALCVTLARERWSLVQALCTR